MIFQMSDIRALSIKLLYVHVDSYTPRHRPISTPSNVVLGVGMKSYLDKYLMFKVYVSVSL